MSDDELIEKMRIEFHRTHVGAYGVLYALRDVVRTHDAEQAKAFRTAELTAERERADRADKRSEFHHQNHLAAEREIDRLTGCLKAANEQAAHFEREWYLRGDAMEKAEAELVALRADADANKARYAWLADKVLACDYGDNDSPDKQIGWRIRADLLPTMAGGRAPVFMYGPSIDAAIDEMRARKWAEGFDAAREGRG
jgi:hypothetical protein